MYPTPNNMAMSGTVLEMESNIGQTTTING